MAAISIRIDDSTKKQFDEFCKSVGLSVSAAFNLFAKTVVREQRIPFEITSENPQFKPEVIEAMEEAERLSCDKTVKRYKTFSDALKDIDLD